MCSGAVNVGMYYAIITWKFDCMYKEPGLNREERS